MESSHVLKMAMLKWKKINIDMLAPSLDEDWKTRLRLKEINSKGLNLLYIWIWVNRNVILLRGMHHVDRWLFINHKCSSQPMWGLSEREKRETNFVLWPSIPRVRYGRVTGVSLTWFVGSSNVIQEFRQSSGVSMSQHLTNLESWLPGHTGRVRYNRPEPNG